MVYSPLADTDRKERLSPPLMYVFRSTNRRSHAGDQDDAAGVRAGKPQRAPITERALQNEVADDLDALLSHVALGASINLADYPAVQGSILNFGFPDIAHRTIDELEGADLDAEITEVLSRYEPRLIAKTLRVVRDASIDKSSLQIRYFVRAELRCEPLDVPVEFIADVDVTTGKLHVGGVKS
jgi:type VI secretion system protein ImpF